MKICSFNDYKCFKDGTRMLKDIKNSYFLVRPENSLLYFLIFNGSYYPVFTSRSNVKSPNSDILNFKIGKEKTLILNFLFELDMKNISRKIPVASRSDYFFDDCFMYPSCIIIYYS